MFAKSHQCYERGLGIGRDTAKHDTTGVAPWKLSPFKHRRVFALFHHPVRVRLRLRGLITEYNFTTVPGVH